MKWTIKEPKQNEAKCVKKFAFFPSKLTDGTWVWLELYEQTFYWNGDEGEGWEAAGRHHV